MLRARKGWTAIACLAAWAVGPALGMALTAHELEHHSDGSHDHSHGEQAAAAFLQGHVHEGDADAHVHDLAPPSSTPSRLGKQDRSELASVAQLSTSELRASCNADAGRALERPPAAPPDLFGLCTLLL